MHRNTHNINIPGLSDTNTRRHIMKIWAINCQTHQHTCTCFLLLGSLTLNGPLNHADVLVFPCSYHWHRAQHRSLFFITARCLYSLMPPSCPNKASQWPDNRTAIGLHGPHNATCCQSTCWHDWHRDSCFYISFGWNIHDGSVKATLFAGETQLNKQSANLFICERAESGSCWSSNV